MYTLKPSITRLASDETIISECGPYVTRPSYPRPSWPALLRLYSKLLPGTTVHEWIEKNNILSLGVDPRRFVSFGIIKGFLRRVHRWPMVLDGASPVLSDQGPELRRRVEFDKSTRVDSSLALSNRTGADSGLTRSGPGDSTFTLRSQGSNMSIGLGISPGQTPFNQKSPRRSANQPRNSLPRSLHSFGDASRKTPTGTIGTLGTLGTQKSSAPGTNGAIRMREQPTHAWDELLSYCDGSHHSDEIQVKFGMGWRELEKVLGLEGCKDGKGKKGIAVVYR